MTALALRPGVGYSFAPEKSKGVSEEAKFIRARVSDSYNDRQYTVTLGWRSELAEELDEILIECSSPGWDGYDADPISGFAAKQLIRLIEMLPEGVGRPDVVPENDGSIGLEWRNSLGMILVLSLDATELTYAALLGTHYKATGIREFSDEIPQEVLDLLYRYFTIL